MSLRPIACGVRLWAVVVVAIGTTPGCAQRVEPVLSAEPRLEATIEALGDEIMRLRLERDSLAARRDSLVAQRDSLDAQLTRLKSIDLRRKPKGGAGGR